MYAKQTRTLALGSPSLISHEAGYEPHTGL